MNHGKLVGVSFIYHTHTTRSHKLYNRPTFRPSGYNIYVTYIDPAAQRLKLYYIRHKENARAYL